MPEHVDLRFNLRVPRTHDARGVRPATPYNAGLDAETLKSLSGPPERHRLAIARRPSAVVSPNPGTATLELVGAISIRLLARIFDRDGLAISPLESR